MNRLRLVVIVAGGLVGLTGTLLACSSDDTVISADSGTGDSGRDQSTPDTSVDVPDSGTDAPVFPDAGLTLANYQAKLATTLCKALARCCFGNENLGANAPVDGGTYNKASCEQFYTAVGFESSAGEIPPTDVNLVLDNAKGDECISKLNTLVCDTPGAMYTAVAQACFGARVGKQTAGQPCAFAVECAPGNFCTNGDGGTGVCAPVRGSAGNCGDWFPTEDPINNAERSGEACSYRGKGVDTGRYCDFYDFVLLDYRPQAAWTCKTAGGLGANCASTPWCKDALCDDLNTATCVSPKQFFATTAAGNPAGCGKFITP